ncbi:hypothetical protein HDV06_006936 [Boothiomyces sp. JEL0866]|nr:hypothetical protein HDV06_006936 [Boothiomyces sp. JEL0866]
MKLVNYEIGKTIGEGSFGKVKLGKYLPTGEKKLKDIETQKKKLQQDIDKVLLRNIHKDAYKECVRENAIDQDVNLAQFISKLKTTGELDSFEREPSVSDSMSHFQQEILLMMRFNHPNIIKIYQVIEAPEDIYVVMEYAPGGDLSTYVGIHGRLSEVEARRIFRQIISAIDFVHSSKVVHRDLKMENILLDHNRNAMITDFGLGRGFKNNDYMKTFCGTPYYSAPEMVAGKPYNGIKTDIWAIGVILYVMVSGVLPFTGDSIRSLFKQIKKAEYNIPQDLSWELIDLIRFILIEDPEKRLSMQEIRNHRWVNIGYNERPKYNDPVEINKESLAKLISSVTNEDGCTLYTINHHKEEIEDRRRSQSNLKIKRRNTVQSFKIDLQSPTLTFPTPTSPTLTSPTLASATVKAESFGIIVPGRHSLTVKNRKGFTIDETESSSIPLSHIESREVSVVNRMSTPSILAFEVNTNEINSWHGIHKPPKFIRTMKFNFKKGLYSSLDPPTMFKDLHRALVEIKQTTDLQITKLEGFYLFRIELNDVAIEIELCKVWLLNIHGLKITKNGECGSFVKTLISKLCWTVFNK